MPNMRFLILFYENCWKTLKIDYPSTFALFKIFWDVVWSRQVHRWIAGDLSNTLQTYRVVRRCVRRSETALFWITSFSKFFQNGNFCSNIHWKWLWKAMKTKKSLPAHVWDHRNRLTRRMTIPIVSADVLGPKQVSQSHQMHQGVNKKIFRAL